MGAPEGAPTHGYRGHSGKLSRLSGCSPSASVFKYLLPTRLTATTVHMKRPLAAFNARDGLGSAEAPALSVWVDAADTKNPLMRIVAIAFVDTFDLVAHMPCSCCCGARPPLARPRHVAASRSQGMRPSKSIVETLKMA